ncbi:MAG: methyltransferase [Verrucomicrobiota bacterium]
MTEIPPDTSRARDWEGRYQEGHTPWDKGAASPGLLDFLRTHPWQGRRVVVPGCGLGHDVRALAAAGLESVGLDIAPSAIAAAQAAPAVPLASFHQADLFQLPARWRGAFDCVWEHTCFCAISPLHRQEYVAAIASLLRPGGTFLAVFFLDPETQSGPPFGTTKEELHRRFDRSFEVEQEWQPENAYPGRVGREWMWRARLR